MKIISKSNDVYMINDVKKGTTEKGKNWYRAQLENSDGRVNLFVSDFNADKVIDNIGNKCYIIFEYIENYNKNTNKSYTAYTIKDIEVV